MNEHALTRLRLSSCSLIALLACGDGGAGAGNGPVDGGTPTNGGAWSDGGAGIPGTTRASALKEQSGANDVLENGAPMGGAGTPDTAGAGASNEWTEANARDAGPQPDATVGSPGLVSDEGTDGSDVGGDGAAIFFPNRAGELHVARLGPAHRTNIPITRLSSAGERVVAYQVSRDQKQVAYFVSVDEQSVDLHAVRSDGTGRVRVAEGLPLRIGFLSRFQLAPDGSRISYFTESAPGSRRPRYFTVNTDGSRTARLGENTKSVFWAPDGSRVAYVDQPDRNSPVVELYTSLPDGSQAQSISRQFEGGVSQLIWSPDGSRIVYALLDRQTTDEPTTNLTLYAVRPDGSELTEVERSFNVPNDAIAWAPDSTRIAYVAMIDLAEGYNLYTAKPDGTEKAELSGDLTPVAVNNISIRWAPDGSRIAFADDPGRRWPESGGLYTVRPNGDALTRVSGDLVSSQRIVTFAWAPDSSRIAFRVTTDGTGDGLSTVRPDGSELFRASGKRFPVDGGRELLRWAPDSSRIAFLAELESASGLPRLRHLYTVRPTETAAIRVGGDDQTTVSAIATWTGDSAILTFTRNVLPGATPDAAIMAASPDGEWKAVVAWPQR